MLIELLSTGEEAAQERAVNALRALVHENSDAHQTIAKAGNPAALVALLKASTNADAKDYALWSLSLSINETNQKTLLEEDGVVPLVEVLHAEAQTPPRGWRSWQAVAGEGAVMV